MSSRAHELWRFFDSCVGLVPKIHTKERSSLFLGTPPQKSILHHAVAHQSWDEADATSGHKLPYSPFHHNLDIAEFNLPWITFSRLLLMQYSRADFHRLFFFPSPPYCILSRWAHSVWNTFKKVSFHCLKVCQQRHRNFERLSNSEKLFDKRHLTIYWILSV